MGCALNDRSNVRAGMVPRYAPEDGLALQAPAIQPDIGVVGRRLDQSETGPLHAFVVQQCAARRVGDRSMGNDELLR